MVTPKTGRRKKTGSPKTLPKTRKKTEKLGTPKNAGARARGGSSRTPKTRMKQLALPATGIAPKPRGKSKRYVVEVLHGHDDKVLGAAVTYQRELVNCGKRNCRRCRKRPGHGPYIYAYWSDGGKTRSLYIGKQRRTALEVLVRRRNNRKNKGSEHEQQQQESR